jgi:hypothetical protein
MTKNGGQKSRDTIPLSTNRPYLLLPGLFGPWTLGILNAYSRSIMKHGNFNQIYNSLGTPQDCL